MKRFIIFFTFLALIFAYPALAESDIGAGLISGSDTNELAPPPKQTPEYIPGANWYLDTALEMAAGIGALAADEAYLFIFMGDVSAECEVLAQYDFTSPSAGYSFPGVSLEELKENYRWMYAALSPEGLDAFCRTMLKYAVLADQSEPYDTMAMHTWLTRSAVEPDDFQPQMILLDYGGLYVLVQFAQFSEGTVDISATFAYSGKSLTGIAFEIMDGGLYGLQTQIY